MQVSQSEVERVRAAWQAGALEAALQLALDVWRQSRSGVLAEVIATIGADAPPFPVVPDRAADFDALWHAQLDDLVTRGPALAHLTSLLPGQYPMEWRAALAARLAHLAELDGDPRVAAALVRLLDDAPPELLGNDVQAQLIAAGRRHVDERTRDWLLDLGGHGGPPAVPLSASQLEPWRALLAHRPVATRALTTWDAVRADPDDDAALGVLADHLLDQNDPRGEFITLQLKDAQAHASEAEVERAEHLLREHTRDFLGGLERVTVRAQFRRGLLYRLELDGPWSAPAADWVRAAADPALLSVEALPVGNATSAEYASFVRSPTMKRLRAVSVWDEVTLSAVASTAAPVTHVDCLRWPEHTFATYVVPVLERLPLLRSLALAPSMVASLRTSKLLRRLQTLVVARLPYAFTLRAELPASVTVQCGDELLAPCLPSAEAWGGVATLTAQALTVRGRWLAGEVLRHLDRLPGSLTTLRLMGPTDEALVEAAQARALRVEVVPEPPLRGCVTRRP